MTEDVSLIGRKKALQGKMITVQFNENEALKTSVEMHILIFTAANNPRLFVEEN